MVVSEEPEEQRLCHPKSENADVLSFRKSKTGLKESVETDTGPYPKGNNLLVIERKFSTVRDLFHLLGLSGGFVIA